MTKVWSVLTLLLLGCPNEAAFQPADAATAEDTDAVDSAATTTDATATDTHVDACLETCAAAIRAGTCAAAPPCAPCGCASGTQCTDELCGARDDFEAIVATTSPLGLAASVEARGVPEVVTLALDLGELPITSTRYVDASWSPTTLFGDLRAGPRVQVAMGREANDQAHLLVYVGTGDTAYTHWIHRGESDWVRGSFLDGEGCLDARLLRDATGVLHAGCMSGVNFRMARLGATEWTQEHLIENVAGPVGWTVDAQGAPQFATTSANGDVRYGVWKSNRWAVTPVVVVRLVNDASRLTAVALDANERPHIIHQAEDDGVPLLLDNQYDGVEWLGDEIARAPLAGLPFGDSMALERGDDGRLHLIYRDDLKLVYHRFDGTWGAPQRSAAIVSEAGLAALTIDAGGLAHIAYLDDAGMVRWWTPADTD